MRIVATLKKEQSAALAKCLAILASKKETKFLPRVSVVVGDAIVNYLVKLKTEEKTCA